MEPYSILVIFLSIALAVFLVAGTITLILVIKLLSSVKEATRNAKHAVENVEDFTSQLKKVGKATIIGSTVAQVLNIFKKERK